MTTIIHHGTEIFKKKSLKQFSSNTFNKKTMS